MKFTGNSIIIIILSSALLVHGIYISNGWIIFGAFLFAIFSGVKF